MDEHEPGKVWTYDDLVAMGEPTDGRKYEIFDGELVVSPSPLYWHQEVSYKPVGWYGPGDLAKSHTLPIELAIDPLFAPDED